MFFVDKYRGQRALYDMNPMTAITLKNVTFCVTYLIVMYFWFYCPDKQPTIVEYEFFA